MLTRHAVLLLALIGSFGAAALAIAAHRSRLSLELAQRVGGEDVRSAILASTRFSHVQELGFLALALIFLALFLMHISLKSEPQRLSPRAELPPKAAPLPTPPPTVPVPVVALELPNPASEPVPIAQPVPAPAKPPAEERAAPHA